MAEWNPKANEIYVRAASIEPPVDRLRFIKEQCDGDSALEAQVESLLAAGGKIGSFLDRPAVNRALAENDTGAYRPLTEGPGTVIGPYKLLQHIGEGGFGAVYMAEQEHPVRRKVALKIIKPGMDTREVIARFESERQALAMMEHPNIARVFDAGATESGRPYFVMELVRGIPITEFCDRNKLPAEERLKLFVTVCHAIQHAHHKGIIHRDIKPSNVMITLHDGVPVVKVIDFGVAKATAQKLTDRTLFTAYGQMIGTPAYMSPEQAEMSGLDIDTRSDIFSLGVLLYELLTGTTPLDSKHLRQAGYAEMQRMIREEEAPRPSTRFSSMGGEATALANNRSTDVRRLSQLLRSDLDWIVMKSLEKDRNRRYGSPATFAADVERHLTEQPVEARPPSAWYRLCKTYRRNRVALTTAAAMVAVMAVGTAVSVWQAVRAKDAELAAIAARNAEVDQRLIAVDAAQDASRQRDKAEAARTDLRQTLYASDLQMAASLWQAKDQARTLEMLDRQRPQAGEPDLRGFEWHFLNRQSRTAARTLSLQEGFKRFTPDGRRVYVAQRADQRKDGKTISTLRSWDLDTGKELPEWEPFPGQPVTFLTVAGFSHSGARVLVGYRIGDSQPGQGLQVEYKVFDRQTHQELFSLKRQEQSGGRLLTPLLDHGGRQLAVHYLDENSRPGSKVTIWNVDEQKIARVISLDATKRELFEQKGMAFHPNGKHFAAFVIAHVSESGMAFQLRVWDLQTGAEISRFRMDQANNDGLIYSPDGTYLAWTSLETDMIKLRETQGEKKFVQSYRIPDVGNQFMSKTLSFSPDGSRLGVSLSNLPGVHVFAIKPQLGEIPPIRSIPTDSHFTRVGFTADSKSVVVARAGSPDVSFYEINQSATLLSGPDAIRSPFRTAGMETVRRPITLSGVSANHGLAWAVWAVESPGTPKAEVRAWDATGRVVFQVQIDDLEGRYAGTMTRDGKRFILVQSSRHKTDPTLDRARIQVWDVESRAVLSDKEMPGESISVWGVDPAGKTLAISNLRMKRPQSSTSVLLGTRLSLWDLQTHREIHGEDIADSVGGAVMSPDGTRVAWAINTRNVGTRSAVRVWDTATGKDVWARNDWGPRDLNFDPDRMVFSRDGRTLVIATLRVAGEQIYVLDADTGLDRRPPLLNTDGELTDLCLSEDGRRLFALATRLRNTIVVWDLVTGRKLLTLPVNNVLGQTAMTTDRAGQRIYLLKDLPGNGKLELETFDATPLPEPAK